MNMVVTKRGIDWNRADPKNVGTLSEISMVWARACNLGNGEKERVHKPGEYGTYVTHQHYENLAGKSICLTEAMKGLKESHAARLILSDSLEQSLTAAFKGHVVNGSAEVGYTDLETPKPTTEGTT